MAKQARSRQHSIADSLRLHAISSAFQRSRQDLELLRHFPVALIAVVEDFIRGAIRTLVDSVPGCLESFLQSQLAREQKLDLGVLRAIAVRRITVGELVAHLPKIISVESIETAMVATMGTGFKARLATVHDRWSVQVEKKPIEPIVADVERMFATLANTFRYRHILAHEAAGGLAVTPEEVGEQIQAVAAFVRVTDELVGELVTPNAPLTQTDMNIHAAQSAREATERLDALLGQTKGFLSEKRFALLQRAQGEWETYSETQVTVEGLAYEGGSMRPMIEAGAREELTKARIADVGRLLLDPETGERVTDGRIAEIQALREVG